MYFSSSIQHRINMFDKRTDSGSTQAPVTNSASTNQGKLHKQRPKSDAFEMFEKKGIIISPVSMGSCAVLQSLIFIFEK